MLSALNSKRDIRFVNINQTIYLRKEDVVAYIQELATSEETDTRNRIEEAAKNIGRIGNGR